MKLKDLEIFTVGTPPPGWGGRYWIFVKLTTDTGIVGYGEVYAASVGPSAMEHVIRDVFERHMYGENPENVEMMFRRAYSSGFTQRPDLTVIGAFSGLEIACCAAQQMSIGPDPAHAFDRSAGKRDRQRDRVAVARGLRPTLAATRSLAPLGKVARPDHAAGHADAAIQSRDGLAVTGGAHRQLVQTWPFAPPIADNLAVQTAAERRTDSAAKRSPDQRSDRSEY